MRKKILGLTLAVIFCLTSLIPTAVAAEKTKTAPSKTKPAINQPAAQSTNDITKAALKAGVRTCSNRINFLIAGAKDAGYMMFFSKNNPDRQMTSLSIELPLKDDSSAYASASFAPGQANSCAGMYETVVYWP